MDDQCDSGSCQGWVVVALSANRFDTSISKTIVKHITNRDSLKEAWTDLSCHAGNALASDVPANNGEKPDCVISLRKLVPSNLKVTFEVAQERVWASKVSAQVSNKRQVDTTDLFATIHDDALLALQEDHFHDMGSYVTISGMGAALQTAGGLFASSDSCSHYDTAGATPTSGSCQGWIVTHIYDTDVNNHIPISNMASLRAAWKKIVSDVDTPLNVALGVAPPTCSNRRELHACMALDTSNALRLTAHGASNLGGNVGDKIISFKVGYAVRTKSSAQLTDSMYTAGSSAVTVTETGAKDAMLDGNREGAEGCDGAENGCVGWSIISLTSNDVTLPITDEASLKAAWGSDSRSCASEECYLGLRKNDAGDEVFDYVQTYLQSVKDTGAAPSGCDLWTNSACNRAVANTKVVEVKNQGWNGDYFAFTNVQSTATLDTTGSFVTLGASAHVVAETLAKLDLTDYANDKNGYYVSKISRRIANKLEEVAISNLEELRDAWGNNGIPVAGTGSGNPILNCHHSVGDYETTPCSIVLQQPDTARDFIGAGSFAFAAQLTRELNPVTLTLDLPSKACNNDVAIKIVVSYKDFIGPVLLESMTDMLNNNKLATETFDMHFSEPIASADLKANLLEKVVHGSAKVVPYDDVATKIFGPIIR
jgi:hypothetical protein